MFVIILGWVTVHNVCDTLEIKSPTDTKRSCKKRAFAAAVDCEPTFVAQIQMPSIEIDGHYLKLTDHNYLNREKGFDIAAWTVVNCSDRFYLTQMRPEV